jgi:hypothetical protein
LEVIPKMLKRLTTHLTYANVIATICLFVVLGGTAWATTAVTGHQVQDGSLTGADIANHSISASKLVPSADAARKKKHRKKKPKTVAGPQGAQGVAGATGPQGTTGPQGPQGSAGTNGSNGTNGTNGANGTNAFGKVTYKKQANVPVPGNQTKAVTIACESGDVAISGGYQVPASDDQVIVKHSLATNLAGSQPGSEAWTVFVDDTTASPSSVTVEAICVPAAQVTGP